MVRRPLAWSNSAVTLWTFCVSFGGALTFSSCTWPHQSGDQAALTPSGPRAGAPCGAPERALVGGCGQDRVSAPDGAGVEFGGGRHQRVGVAVADTLGTEQGGDDPFPAEKANQPPPPSGLLRSETPGQTDVLQPPSRPRAPPDKGTARTGSCPGAAIPHPQAGSPRAPGSRGRLRNGMLEPASVGSGEQRHAWTPSATLSEPLTCTAVLH